MGAQSDRGHEVGITWNHRNEVLEFDSLKWLKLWYNKCGDCNDR